MLPVSRFHVFKNLAPNPTALKASMQALNKALEPLEAYVWYNPQQDVYVVDLHDSLERGRYALLLDTLANHGYSLQRRKEFRSSIELPIR